MARARNIKPGFFLNDELAEIEVIGRLLFAGLWTIADREGRLEDRPKKIKAAVLPYDDCDVDDLLQKLHNKNFILRYEVEGCKYIQIINFIKHQNPHKNEAPSSIPAPYLHSTSTVQEQELHTTNPADSLNLIPDSLNLIPDSLNLIPEIDNQEKIIILQPDEQEFLQVLQSIPNYPFDREKDLQMYHTMRERYPELDHIEAIKDWKVYKTDHPIKTRDSPRAQINNSFKNYVKWGRCPKRGGMSSASDRGDNGAIAPDYNKFYNQEPNF